MFDEQGNFCRKLSTMDILNFIESSLGREIRDRVRGYITAVDHIRWSIRRGKTFTMSELEDWINRCVEE